MDQSERIRLSKNERGLEKSGGIWNWREKRGFYKRKEESGTGENIFPRGNSTGEVQASPKLGSMATNWLADQAQ